MEPTREFFEFIPGSVRNVILLNNWAIKIPRFHSFRKFIRGMLVNINERKYWNKNKFCGKLNPVLFGAWGGFFNVQKRVTPLTKQEFRAIRIKEFRNIFGGTKNIPVEHDINAFGKDSSGNIVAIDYGTR
jgi:hypothetical protein